jgi:aminopeptidase N
VLAPDRLTQDEARLRSQAVSAVRYSLHLDLEAGAKTYAGDCTVRFTHHGPDGTFLDFTGSVIEHFSVNGIDREPVWHQNRLQLAPGWLEPENQIRIRYVNNYDHSGEGFHQFFDPEDGSEYLYSQFEPFSAHRMFPCFDQPDLKATYELAVTAPAAWEVITASPQVAVDEEADGRVRRLYEATVAFSTYLVSVVAGPYQSVRSEHNGIPLGLYCRASLFEHLDADELFELTAAGVDFFADFFGHAYPFAKYDQVFVPEFNWGGMENVGNVTYSEGYIFRDPPTDNQRMARAELFLHELAHQWFGDLVTMQWWNDVWLNESFATYMAYLGLERVTRYNQGWQDFQADMKLWAMEEDQLPTTHKVADHVATTDETFLNFDGITYGKGASALKQLVASVGEDVFREGMRVYFAKFAFSNATLSDFLTSVAEGSGTDLHAWSAAWLEASSLDTLAVEWHTVDGAVAGMDLVQEGPPGDDTVRSHSVAVAVVRQADSGLVVESHPVQISGGRQSVESAIGGSDPLLVFPNHGDHTYAKVVLDQRSLDFAQQRLDEISDPMLRQQLWTSLWDMVRDQHFSSLDYLELVEDNLVFESNLHILKVVTDTATGAIHRYVPEAGRVGETSRFVAAAVRAMEAAPPGDPRVLWLRAALRVAEVSSDLEVLAGLVDGESAVDGLAIDQEMRWALAIRTSAAGLADAADRATRELERDPSHRGQRSMLSVETAVPVSSAKQEAWERIHGEGYGSLTLDRAAMAGFNWASQAELLAPFVEPFFAGVHGVFEAREHEVASAYFRALLPRYRVDEEALGFAAAALDYSDEPPALHRLLIEAIDRLERALACRARAG